MSSKKRNYTKRERHIVVRGHRREAPDVRKLGRALIALAQSQNEAEAQTQVPPRAPTVRPIDADAEVPAEGNDV